MTDIQSQLEQLKTEDYQQDQTRLCTMMAFRTECEQKLCDYPHSLPHQNKLDSAFLRKRK